MSFLLIFRTWFRSIILWLAFFSSISFVSANAKPADQLLMITSDTCSWCEAFENEVGGIYYKTKEAQKLPLQRHNFYDQFPDYLSHITPATMTPTFIIIFEGSEKGRIIGYPGSELFWWRLSEFF